MISAQLAGLSFFHEAEDSGYSLRNSVVTVAKWNYVEASFTVTIVPMVENGTTNVNIMINKAVEAKSTFCLFSILLHPNLQL